MKHKLIVFTQDFPFEKNEPFLESELPYLEEVFDDVLIIATSLHKGYQQTRTVGPSTKILPLMRPNGKLKKIWGVLNGIRYFSRNVKLEFKKQNGIKGKIAILYYAGRYEAVKRRCSRTIKSFVGNDADQTVTFYSYWFIETAQVALFYAEQLEKENIICKTCTRAHGFDLYEIRNPAGFFPFREYVLKSINYVYPCSEDGKQYLIQHYPRYKEKIFKRYLGTCEHGMNPEKGNGYFTIVTCSNLVPVKRLDLVAEALKYLELLYSDIKIKWICIGDGPEREHIQGLVSSLKVCKVDFLGSMKNAEVLEWYKSNHVDLFVNTSSSEGLPVSIMEVSSFGIPSLATNVGGTSEIVIEAENGKLLPENLTAEMLGEEIKYFFEMPLAERERLRLRARQIWENSFSAEKNYRAFAEELHSGH